MYYGHIIDGQINVISRNFKFIQRWWRDAEYNGEYKEYKNKIIKGLANISKETGLTISEIKKHFMY